MRPDAPLSFQPAPAIQPGRRTRALPEVSLEEVGIHALSEAECVRYVLDRLDEAQGGWLLTQDLDHLRRMIRDPDYRAVCEQAELRVPDGRVTTWSCHLQRTPVPEPVSGPSLIWSFSRAAAQRRRSVYLLGGRPGTAREAARELGRTFEGLGAVGWHQPLAGFEEDPLAMKRLAHQLEQARPDIVFVGYNAPICANVILALKKKLPDSWWIGVGVSFSFVAGEFRRPPIWVRKIGMEWLTRLLQEPRRLFKPCVMHGIPFASGLLVRSALRGMLPKPKRVGNYGMRRPRALLVDDDPFALNHLEMLLNEAFPELEVVKRTEAVIHGRFDFYFLDNDFDGQQLAGKMAREIRRVHPGAHIFAFSGALDVDALKRLINAGCDGVCEKSQPETWHESMETMRKHLDERAQIARKASRAFGGVRHAAGSIQGLLHDWNERSPVAAATKEEEA